MQVLLYTGPDRRAMQKLCACFPDLSALQVGKTTLEELASQPVQRVLLLMSVDLLNQLVLRYKALYWRLRLFERKGVLVIVYLRACAWDEWFLRPLVLPAGESTISEYPLKKRVAIYR